MPTTFKLPELGENINSGLVAKVLVKEGDVISKDQPVIEVETDKAVVEVPSPVGGAVKEVRAKEGSVIKVGDVIIVIEDGVAAPAAKSPAKPVPEPKHVEAPPEEEEVEGPPEPVKSVTEKKPQEPAKPEPVQASRPAPAQAEAPIPASQRRYAASPSVRRLAREIGVDIDQVVPEEGSTRITIEDVKAYARRAAEAPVRPAAAATPGPVSLPDFKRWGETHREPMSSVRRVTAERLSAAWAAIPHVTQHDKADVTQLEAFRKKYGPRAEAKGGKLTVTAVLVKAVVPALKRFPQFNASIDVAANEIVYKRYYHIGVAVDTDRGLLVPVIRDADKKSIVDIAVELAAAAQRARDRKTSLDELQGATFTITNLGGIGGTAFTPIVNAPEVAILGVSRASVEPVYLDGQFIPRTLMPLSLSYDHRIIDGADAARFLRWICEAIEQPLLMLLED